MIIILKQEGNLIKERSPTQTTQGLYYIGLVCQRITSTGWVYSPPQNSNTGLKNLSSGNDI